MLIKLVLLYCGHFRWYFLIYIDLFRTDEAFMEESFSWNSWFLITQLLFIYRAIIFLRLFFRTTFIFLVNLRINAKWKIIDFTIFLQCLCGSLSLRLAITLIFWTRITLAIIFSAFRWFFLLVLKFSSLGHV